MNSRLFLLLAGTSLAAGLTGAIAAPHLSSAGLDLQSDTAHLYLIDSDDDDDGEHRYRGGEHDDDECEDDDDEGQAVDCLAPALPGGAPIAPPNNGLFQNGSKPAVTVN